MFSAYFVGEEEFFELTADHRPLPYPLSTTRYGLFTAGNNRSDSLGMYWKRQIEGLEPGSRYWVRLTTLFASRVGTGCVGIGGAPGESVHVHAGAYTAEPLAVEHEGFYWMNYENPSIPDESDPPARMGHIGVPGSECSGSDFRMKQLDLDPGRVSVTADERGKAWLIVGTSSGFEGFTELYYVTINATLHR